MTVRPSSSTRALTGTIKEGDESTRDLLLELLLEQKIANLHAAELDDTAFEQDDVKLDAH